jgi:hypothetical protein
VGRNVSLVGSLEYQRATRPSWETAMFDDVLALVTGKEVLRYLQQSKMTATECAM